MNGYFNWDSQLALSEMEAASFAEWMAAPDHPCQFTMHPDGFPVFLRPAEIRQFDEYSQGDPYAVAQHIESTFQRHRIDVTIRLVAEGIVATSRTPRILDVACGEGHITSAIQRAFPRAEILAFDGSLSAIRSAHRTYKGIAFAVADAHDPPYAPCYFDCAVCNNIWEHVPDPVQLVVRIARLLKPDASLIVSTPSRYRLNNLLRVALGKPVALASPHHVTEYSVGQVMEQLRHAGFRVERTAGDTDWPKSLAFRQLIKRGLGYLISGILQITRSHHTLASTVFYLAKNGC